MLLSWFPSGSAIPPRTSKLSLKRARTTMPFLYILIYPILLFFFSLHLPSCQLPFPLSLSQVFDECESLFGARSAEQNTSTDRYANLDVGGSSLSLFPPVFLFSFLSFDSALFPLHLSSSTFSSSQSCYTRWRTTVGCASSPQIKWN